MLCFCYLVLNSQPLWAPGIPHSMLKLISQALFLQLRTGPLGPTTLILIPQGLILLSQQGKSGITPQKSTELQWYKIGEFRIGISGNLHLPGAVQTLIPLTETQEVGRYERGTLSAAPGAASAVSTRSSEEETYKTLTYVYNLPSGRCSSTTGNIISSWNEDG